MRNWLARLNRIQIRTLPANARSLLQRAREAQLVHAPDGIGVRFTSLKLVYGPDAGGKACSRAATTTASRRLRMTL
jgi:hypothetical protein